ncbi:glycosyltransferase [Streptomyces sp. NPDC001185]|uniref:glycosyltransferase n=1 Tax=Streptomyces sp. NPDC001185 TaxID=3154380 RepID=UPI003323123A
MAEIFRSTGQDLWTSVTVETEAEYFAAARVDLAVDDTLAAVRDWHPDLIVSEHFDFVGPLVAAILNVPAASLAFGPAVQPVSVEPLLSRARSRYEARGLQYTQARWYLDTCPPALQNSGWVAPQGRVGLRPEAHRAPGRELPTKSEGSHARPRVLVTYGTSFARPEMIGPLLRGLLGLDVDIRVTLDTSSPEEFGIGDDAVGRIAFVGFTPLAELLQGVDVMLTHGGAGTVLGGLAQGIPMVVTPVSADQPIQAERVARSGAGVSFPVGKAPAEAVTEAVAKVLTDASYRERAQVVAAEIAALPSPADVAEQLALAISR